MSRTQYIDRLIKAERPGSSCFPEIDAVLYISEKHARTLPDGRPAHIIVVIETAGAENHPWKSQFIERVVSAWSRLRTGGPVLEGCESDLYGLEAIHDVQKSLKRYEIWEIEYLRNPYLELLPLEALRVRFHRTRALLSLAFVKGNWSKPPNDRTAEWLRLFQHITMEANRRGIDLRVFDQRLLCVEELNEIHEGLPSELVRLLSR